jgi:hypothetical protein
MTWTTWDSDVWIFFFFVHLLFREDVPEKIVGSDFSAWAVFLFRFVIQIMFEILALPECVSSLFTRLILCLRVTEGLTPLEESSRLLFLFWREWSWAPERALKWVTVMFFVGTGEWEIALGISSSVQMIPFSASMFLSSIPSEVLENFIVHFHSRVD